MRYQVPALAAYRYDGPDYGEPTVKHPREEAGQRGIFSRASNMAEYVGLNGYALGACPPGYFSPTMPEPPAGTPASVVKAVVAKTDAVRATMRGLSGYNAYGAPVVLHNTGESMSQMAGGIFRGSMDGVGDIDVNALLNTGKQFVDTAADMARNAAKQGGGGQQQGPAAPAADAGIFGIPTPVALVGGLVAAAALFMKSKRKNPGRRRR